jgi:hypothetical protein
MIKPQGLYGRQWKPREVHELIYRNGWKDPVTMAMMVATITAESDRYEGAVGKVNANSTQDWGMFQLNSGHWAEWASSPEEFYLICIDAERAAPIARFYFDKDKKTGGSGFGPWFGYKTPRYNDALPDACRGLANFAALRTLGELVL